MATPLLAITHMSTGNTRRRHRHSLFQAVTKYFIRPSSENFGNVDTAILPRCVPLEFHCSPTSPSPVECPTEIFQAEILGRIYRSCRIRMEPMTRRCSRQPREARSGCSTSQSSSFRYFSSKIIAKCSGRYGRHGRCAAYMIVSVGFVLNPFAACACGCFLDACGVWSSCCKTNVFTGMLLVPSTTH